MTDRHYKLILGNIGCVGTVYGKSINSSLQGRILRRPPLLLNDFNDIYYVPKVYYYQAGIWEFII